MRSEWKQVSVKDVCSIKYGKDHKALENGSIPAYGSGGIMRYVSEALYDRPSVLIPRKGTLDNLFFVHEPFWTIDTLFWTVIESEIIDPRFLYYSLLTKNLANKNVGTAVPSLTIKVLNEISLLLPPLPTQEAIAATLSCLDAKIEVNNKINENLEQQAQAIFKSWFVDFEPFQDGEFVESELGMIPKGWRVGTLEEVGQIVGGATPRKNEKENYRENGIPWITPRDLSIQQTTFVSRGETDISEIGLNSTSVTLMPRGTILFSSRAPIGYMAIAKNELGTNQGFKSIVPFKDYGTYFVYNLVKINLCRIEALGSGSTFKEVSGTVMRNVTVIIPDKESVRRYNSAAKPMYDTIEILEKQNSTLSTLRDTLLPKLMSGEITVPIADQ